MPSAVIGLNGLTTAEFYRILRPPIGTQVFAPDLSRVAPFILPDLQTAHRSGIAFNFQ
jgi:hypothetical protein